MVVGRLLGFREEQEEIMKAHNGSIKLGEVMSLNLTMLSVMPS